MEEEKLPAEGFLLKSENAIRFSVVAGIQTDDFAAGFVGCCCRVWTISLYRDGCEKRREPLAIGQGAVSNHQLLKNVASGQRFSRASVAEM